MALEICQNTFLPSGIFSQLPERLVLLDAHLTLFSGKSVHLGMQVCGGWTLVLTAISLNYHKCLSLEVSGTLWAGTKCDLQRRDLQIIASI